MTCFWTCRPGAHFDLAADAERIDPLIAGGGDRAGPNRLPAVGLLALHPHHAGAITALQHQLEAAVAVQIRGGGDPAGQLAAARLTETAAGEARAIREPAGPEVMRSPAPLLSRSATSSRAFPGASPGGASNCATRAASKLESVQLSREPCDRAIGPDAEDVDDAIAAEVGDRECGDPGELARHGPFAERRAAEVEKDAKDALIVEQGRVGHAFAVEIGPGEAAHARQRAERRLRGKRAVAVVAQHSHGTVSGCDDEVQIAVGVDVGRPDARAAAR